MSRYYLHETAVMLIYILVDSYIQHSFVGHCCLTHWGRAMHICISKLTIIGSDNGLSPPRHQAIIWTHARVLLIQIPGTNFSETLSKIHTVSLKKMHLKLSSAKWPQSCLGLNVLTYWSWENGRFYQITSDTCVTWSGWAKTLISILLSAIWICKWMFDLCL